MPSRSSNLKLRSSDGEDFEVKEALVLQSGTIKAMINNLPPTLKVVPLVRVTTNVLQKVMDYCDTKAATADNEEDEGKKSAWEARFVEDMDLLTVYDLALAASHLGIPDLFNLAYDSLGEKVGELKGLGEAYKVQDDVFFTS
ncbi:SKP1-like protein 16 [Aristolochia californica]|uniref:SKP1-like protein 16 n=1 Tax=Aristolochia californica TaxID=171875 RepID=UPI0035DDBB04